MYYTEASKGNANHAQNLTSFEQEQGQNTNPTDSEAYSSAPVNNLPPLEVENPRLKVSAGSSTQNQAPDEWEQAFDDVSKAPKDNVRASQSDSAGSSPRSAEAFEIGQYTRTM